MPDFNEHHWAHYERKRQLGQAYDRNQPPRFVTVLLKHRSFEEKKSCKN